MSDTLTQWLVSVGGFLIVKLLFRAMREEAFGGLASISMTPRQASIVSLLVGIICFIIYYPAKPVVRDTYYATVGALRGLGENNKRLNDDYQDAVDLYHNN